MNATIKNAALALVAEVKANGIETILLRKEAEDSLACISVKCRETDEELAEVIINRIPEKYRDHVIGFKYEDRSYSMVMDKEAQEKFDKALREYYHNKAEWCARYGCN